MKKFSWSAIFTAILLMAGSTVLAQPDIAGSNWSGYFRTTGTNNRQSITATIYQTGGSVQIITSKSGLGHYFAGGINTSGHMLVYDQFDGEDWTTHYGPATSSEIALYDYICPTCSQLNVVYLTRPSSPPPPPTPPPTPPPADPEAPSEINGFLAPIYDLLLN